MVESMLFPDSPILRLAWLKRLSGGGGGEPVYKTVSGNPVTFDAVSAPLQQLRVDFSPVQAGSGDPSPTNIRPISGWTGLTATVNGSAVPVSWETEAGTVYGGYVDLLTGELVATWLRWRAKIADYSAKSSGSDGTVQYIYYGSNMPAVKNNSKQKCNLTTYSWTMYSGTAHFFAYTVPAPDGRFSVRLFLLDDLHEDLDIEIVMELEEPIHYQLTPQTIRTIRGSNTISSDGDSMTVTYVEAWQ